MDNNELYHHGVKGMKWGVRRYQNADGTLTAAGKKRYARDAREKEYDKYDETTGKYYKVSKKTGRTDLSADTKRYANEDLERTKRLADSGRNLSSELKRVVDKSNNKRKIQPMDLSNMSDKEMREQINRAMLEKQYNDLFNKQQESIGKAYVGDVLDTVGDALAITGSALGLALIIKQLRG